MLLSHFVSKAAFTNLARFNQVQLQPTKLLRVSSFYAYLRFKCRLLASNCDTFARYNLLLCEFLRLLTSSYQFFCAICAHIAKIFKSRRVPVSVLRVFARTLQILRVSTSTLQLFCDFPIKGDTS